MVQPAREAVGCSGVDPTRPWAGAAGANWVESVNLPMFEGDVALVRESIRRDRPLGDLSWTLAAAKSLGLEYTLRPPGRPRRMVQE